MSLVPPMSSFEATDADKDIYDELKTKVAVPELMETCQVVSDDLEEIMSNRLQLTVHPAYVLQVS